MTSIEAADAWIGRTAIDDTGEQIGLISQIWVDDTSGQPAWASVRGTALAGREAFVPLAGAAPLGSGVQFTSTKEEVVMAPQVAQDGRLSVEGKEQLTSYYGAPTADARPPARSDSWADRIDATRAPSGQGPTSPPAGADLTEAPRKRRRLGRTSGADEAGKATRSERAEKKADEKAGDQAEKDAGTKRGRRFGRSSRASDEMPVGVPPELRELGVTG